MQVRAHCEKSCRADPVADLKENITIDKADPKVWGADISPWYAELDCSQSNVGLGGDSNANSIVDCNIDDDDLSLNWGMTNSLTPAWPATDQGDMGQVRAQCPRTCNSCAKAPVLPNPKAGYCFDQSSFDAQVKVLYYYN